jgi:fatty acid desaturase
MIESIIEIALVASGVLTYLLIAAWTFGTACARFATKASDEGYARAPSWYYDDLAPWFAAGAWPIYVLFSMVLMRVVRLGENRALENANVRKVRVELEKKIRVEQDKIQKEAEQEIEAALRRSA